MVMYGRVQLTQRNRMPNDILYSLSPIGLVSPNEGGWKPEKDEVRKRAKDLCEKLKSLKDFQEQSKEEF